MKKLFAILTLFILSGCATLDTFFEPRASDKYFAPLKITTNRAEIVFQWTDDIGSVCGNPANQGCAIPLGDGKYLIVAKFPRDWNDKYRLEVVGHEIMHALGGMHEKN